MMKSQKEIMLDEKLIQRTASLSEICCPDDTLPSRLMDKLLGNMEVKAIQDYANSVSISRIGLNDHGPVHMKIVCLNALRIFGILHEQGIATSLTSEAAGSISDSMAAVMIASLLHDSGMSIGRKDHELYSGIISFGLISDILKETIPGDENVSRRSIIRSLAMEGILGHMGTRPIHSVEAGIILVSDGCDMTSGRARIPLESHTRPMEGDIHKYSASSIDKVRILKGQERPVRIEVLMHEAVGFFQVEEVLIPKIKASTIRQHVELFAGVMGEDMKRYM